MDILHCFLSNQFITMTVLMNQSKKALMKTTYYCEKLTGIFNDCLNKNKLPNLMKIAEIRPVFKTLNNTSKDNFRCISTSFTKLFESIRFTRLNRYMLNKFSKYLTAFWKNHNTQNSLLRMIQSWKVRLTHGSKVGTIAIYLLWLLIVSTMYCY